MPLSTAIENLQNVLKQWDEMKKEKADLYKALEEYLDEMQQLLIVALEELTKVKTATETEEDFLPPTIIKRHYPELWPPQAAMKGQKEKDHDKYFAPLEKILGITKQLKKL